MGIKTHGYSKMEWLYAVGGLGKNLAYGIVASYTLYYYNTVLGISGSFVGLMLMLARIFDAFNDPIMGVIVARTRSRWGKYKPWIFTGTLLNALVLIAMFTVPEQLSSGAQRVYVTITYVLCGITYTLGDIPYWSIIPAVTGPGEERERMTILARAFSGIGTAAPLIFTLAAVTLLGGGRSLQEYRAGFSRLSVIVAVVFVGTTLLTLSALPKGDGTREEKCISVRRLLSSLAKNDMAIAVSFIIVLFYAATFLTSNLVVYMFRYDIGSERLYTPYMVISGLSQFFALTFGYRMLRKKLSNRQVFLLACIIGLTGYLMLGGLIFARRMTMLKLILPGILISLATGFAYVIATIFVADAVDYGEKQTGYREESMVSSLQTLMAKLSAAFGSFIAGVGLDLARFVERASEEHLTFAMSLRFLFAVPSFILMLAALLILLAKRNIGQDAQKQ